MMQDRKITITDAVIVFLLLVIVMMFFDVRGDVSSVRSEQRSEILERLQAVESGQRAEILARLEHVEDQNALAIVHVQDLREAILKGEPLPDWPQELDGG